MKKYVEKEHDFNEKKLLKKQAKKDAKKSKLKKVSNSSPVLSPKEILNKNLIEEIENNSFWEDIIYWVKQGADPKLKTDRGDDIQVGLIKIFEAWIEDSFDSNFKWGDEDGKMRIKYLKEETEKMINWGVDINNSPENSSSYLAYGNFFYKVTEACFRNIELLELALYMFNKGADINTEFKSAYHGILKERLIRHQKWIEKNPDLAKINILLTLDEKRQLTKNISNDNNLETDVKVTKRL